MLPPSSIRMSCIVERSAAAALLELLRTTASASGEQSITTFLNLLKDRLSGQATRECWRMLLLTYQDAFDGGEKKRPSTSLSLTAVTTDVRIEFALEHCTIGIATVWNEPQNLRIHLKSVGVDLAPLANKLQAASPGTQWIINTVSSEECGEAAD